MKKKSWCGCRLALAERYSLITCPRRRQRRTRRGILADEATGCLCSSPNELDHANANLGRTNPTDKTGADYLAKRTQDQKTLIWSKQTRVRQKRLHALRGLYRITLRGSSFRELRMQRRAAMGNLAERTRGVPIRNPDQTNPSMPTRSLTERSWSRAGCSPERWVPPQASHEGPRCISAVLTAGATCRRGPTTAIRMTERT
jgi:hypothetical protein